MPSSKPDLAVEEEGAKPVRWCIVMPGRQLHKEGAAGLSCPLAQSISGARAPCPGTVDLSEGARSQALLQLGSAASAPLMTTAVLQPGLLGKAGDWACVPLLPVAVLHCKVPLEEGKCGGGAPSSNVSFSSSRADMVELPPSLAGKNKYMRRKVQFRRTGVEQHSQTPTAAKQVEEQLLARYSWWPSPHRQMAEVVES